MAIVSIQTFVPKRVADTIARIAYKIRTTIKDKQVRELASDGVIAFTIKVASAILSFFMFMIIARITDNAEYGLFASGFSIATLLAIVASLGLHTLVLRLWPEYSAQGVPNLARRAVIWACNRTLIASVCVGATLILVAAVLKFATGQSFSYLFAAALLIPALAGAEYIASALRAQGSVLAALAPRDIIWRALVCAFAGVALFAGIKFQASEVILWISVVLIGVVALQIMTLQGRVGYVQHNTGADYTREERSWSQLARPMWAGAVLFSGSQQLDTIIIGVVIGSTAAGSYFAALKIVSVLALPLLAVNQLSGPVMARAFHTGDLAGMQRALKIFMVMIAFVEMVMCLGIVIFGHELLALFDSTFSGAYPVLLLLSASYLFHSLSGPAGMLLQMTGHSRLALKTSLSTQVASLVLLPIAGLAFGPVGVAGVRLAEVGIRNTLQAFHGYRKFGIHTSIMALLRVPDRASRINAM